MFSCPRHLCDLTQESDAFFPKRRPNRGVAVLFPKSLKVNPLSIVFTFIKFSMFSAIEDARHDLVSMHDRARSPTQKLLGYLLLDSTELVSLVSLMCALFIRFIFHQW